MYNSCGLASALPIMGITNTKYHSIDDQLVMPKALPTYVNIAMTIFFTLSRPIVNAMVLGVGNAYNR